MNTSSTTRNLVRLGPIILAYAAFIALGMPTACWASPGPPCERTLACRSTRWACCCWPSVAGYITSSFSGALVGAHRGGRLLASVVCPHRHGAVRYTLVPRVVDDGAVGRGGWLRRGAIDAGLNTYAAAHFAEGLVQAPRQLRHRHHARSHYHDRADRRRLWRVGYRVVAGFRFVMALAFVLTSVVVERPRNQISAEVKRENA